MDKASLRSKHPRLFNLYLLELHIPQFKLAKIIHKTFGYPMDNSTIYRLKRTYEEITESLSRGKLMHADETHVSVKGKASYAWVFTSMEEVIYIWSKTREGGVAGQFLKTLKGSWYPIFIRLTTQLSGRKFERRPR
jgi:hypothetical protein